MSLIPIGFKADSETNARKGKIRAEDYAALCAFSLPRKTGVLDLLNRISDGGVTISGGVATITLHSGYAIICGRPVKVEEGTTYEVELPSSSENGHFGIRIDLGASADNECTFFAKTGVLTQDDLNENPIDGVFEFALYSYTATNSSFALTGNVADLIVGGDVSEAALYTSDEEGNIDRTKTVSDKLSDIEARLTALGFKEGVIASSASGVTIGGAEIKRLGYFVIGRVALELTSFDPSGNTPMFIIPSGFRPKGPQGTYVWGRYGIERGTAVPDERIVYFGTDGNVRIQETNMYSSANPISGKMIILFGYNAEEV